MAPYAITVPAADEEELAELRDRLRGAVRNSAQLVILERDNDVKKAVPDLTIYVSAWVEAKDEDGRELWRASLTRHPHSSAISGREGYVTFGTTL